MSAADRIRALYDSGTPGPWRQSRIMGRGVLIRECRDDLLLADATDEADAAKIVAAVNALPQVADLRKCHEGHHFEGDTPFCAGCAEPWPCAEERVWMPVLAALGVDSE